MAPGTGVDRREATGLWLLYLVWFYPCWWLAQALVGAGPELARAALEGTAPRVRASAFGFSGPAGRSTAHLVCAVASAIGVWGSCAWIARKGDSVRPIASVAGVWISYALLGLGLFPMAVRLQFRPDYIAVASIGFVALILSIARLPAPALARRRASRAGFFAASILLPLAAGYLTPAVLQSEFRPLGLTWLALAVLAAIAIAAHRTPMNAPVGSARVLPGIALGIAVSLVVFFGAERLGTALSIRAEAQRQASMAPVPDPSRLPPVDESFYYKGVNFTAEWPHPYGSKVAAQVLSELPGYGVNSVALVPYASQRPEAAELRFPLRMERDELIVATARIAHAEGLRVLLKPQVWVRGGGLYPGDLYYDDAIDRNRWFASYARFVEHYSKLATRIDADMFCVGVEFAQLTAHEAEWRELIALARTHYAGPLVYAANFGEEFESVRFWDALDFIGLDNYYPLPADRSVDAVAAKVERVHLRFGKPVLFTEAGFSTYELAHEKPWEDRPGGALSPQSQARNVEALLRGFHGRPWLRGIFWWKVGTSAKGGVEDGSHILWGKPAMDVIGQWFLRPADPARVYE